MIKLKCPGCGVALKIPDSFAGKKSPCPKCRKVIPIPAPELEPEEEELLAKVEDDEVEETDPVEEVEEAEEKPAPKRGGKKPAKRAAEEEEVEEAPEEEEEEKPPPKRKNRKPVRRAADEDEEDEEVDRPRKKIGKAASGQSFFTYKRISGAVGVVLGLGALGYGLATGLSGGFEYTQIVCTVFGSLLVATGVFYIVKS